MVAILWNFCVHWTSNTGKGCEWHHVMFKTIRILVKTIRGTALELDQTKVQHNRCTTAYGLDLFLKKNKTTFYFFHNETARVNDVNNRHDCSDMSESVVCLLQLRSLIHPCYLKPHSKQSFSSLSLCPPLLPQLLTWGPSKALCSGAVRKALPSQFLHQHLIHTARSDNVISCSVKIHSASLRHRLQFCRTTSSLSSGYYWSLGAKTYGETTTLITVYIKCDNIHFVI